MALLDFFSFILHIINAVIVPLIFAVAFLTFIWGIFQYFIAADEEKRKKGREFVIYGIIGLFLMTAVWGVVSVFLGTFGFDRGSRPNLPYFEGNTWFGSSRTGGSSSRFPAGDCRNLPNGCPAGQRCTTTSSANTFYVCR